MPLAARISYISESLHFTAKGYAVRVFRHGREFRRLLAELEESQWFPEDRHREQQDRKLRALVAHAYENVPYYHSLFDRHGLRPSDIRGVEDLPKIPPLSKETLRTRGGELVARTIPERLLFPGWTTGSTGSPVNALRTRRSIAFEHATQWRQRRWAGIGLSDRNAAVWGTVWNNVILPASSYEGPPYWRYNAADHQMLFSYYHISEETLPLYLERLAEFRPASLEGFPSTLLILAQALNRRRATIPIRAVFSSSEPLYGVHRSQIEQAFETKVFDLYGQAERVVCATECGMHTGLHVNPEYGILEVLAGDRKAGPGESGQIVGTGLNNYGMPLLRYMTGDTARVSPTLCPCGRAMPLLDTVEGRVADTIVTPDGRRIPGDGIMCAFHGIGNIARSQVVQEGPDTLVVYIVPDGAPATVDTARLIRALKECVGPEMKIESRLVTSLDKSPGGKFRWVVSHCGVKNGSQLLVTGNEPSQRE